MGLFGSLFDGGKKTESGLPREIEKMFEQTARFMQDEKLQNASYPPQLKNQLVSGYDGDELPNAVGDFGRTEKNPIPVNGPVGELIYLSSLVSEDGQEILFHRLGSINQIDIYETVSIDGKKWDVLFFSLYHPRKSKNAPTGYSISTDRDKPAIFGTNDKIDNFPYDLRRAIMNTTKEMFGVPMPPPQVEQAEQSVKFQQTGDQEDRVRSLAASMHGLTQG